MALKLKKTTSKVTITTSSNTSMAESSQADSEIVIISQFRSVLKQIENNQKAFDIRISNIGVIKLKMPIIKRFNGIKLKLKGFFT